MKKILELYGERFNNGGQEKFTMNMFRNFSYSFSIEYSFYTPFSWLNKENREELEDMGCKVYSGESVFDSRLRKYSFMKNVDNFLKKHKFDVVHIHSGSTFELAKGAEIAKKNGIGVVIVHSHATGYNNFKYKIIKKYSENIFLHNVDYYFACSDDAAKWRFPSDIIDSRNFRIIKNGIDLNKYKFNKQIRNRIRSAYNVENSFVLVSVGRLSNSKNFPFTIKIFASVLKKIEDSKLWIIGDGEEKESLKNLVSSLHISDKVHFWGNRTDVYDLLQACDAFILPSFFEGLGISIIEAQAAGLPTFCSENIPEEANVSNLFIRMRIDEGEEAWAKKIINSRSLQRTDGSKCVREHGYDIKQAALDLENTYSYICNCEVQ